MIVVAGGTGRLGRMVVPALGALGCDVRVLTRDAGRARVVLGEDVDLVEADVRRPESLVDAVAGAQVVVSAVHGFLGGRRDGPAAIDVRGNAHLVRAAASADASVVLTSIIGASPHSGAELLRAKFAAERALRSSGVPWTIVRSGPFVETWVEVLRETRDVSGRCLVLGRGARPMSFVSVHDVAEVVVRAASDAALRDQVWEIGGEPMTMLELARAVQSADGSQAPPRHLPRGALRTAGFVTRPFNPAFARKSRMALVMDTVDLGEGDPGLLRRLGIARATSLADVLS